MKKYNINDIVLICKEFGHVYSNGYINTNTKFNCVCKCGSNWYTYLYVIQRGCTCINCKLGNTILDKESIKNELESLGLTILSPIIDSKTPLVYLCTCGGVGKTILGHIRNGIRCGHCAEMRWRSYFLDFGCEIISYKSKMCIKYRCSCGEEHTTQANNFKVSGKKCPKCRFIKAHNIKIKPRPSLTWKKLVLTRDNFECQICSIDYDLQVHHIEAYSIKPELADDINNGITLCYGCHREIHRTYGINAGRQL